jgi:hypothetical protein
MQTTHEIDLVEIEQPDDHARQAMHAFVDEWNRAHARRFEARFPDWLAIAIDAQDPAWPELSRALDELRDTHGVEVMIATRRTYDHDDAIAADLVQIGAPLPMEDSPAAIDDRCFGPQERCARCGWSDPLSRRQVRDLRMDPRAFTAPALAFGGAAVDAPPGGWPLLWVPHGLVVAWRIHAALVAGGVGGFDTRPIFVGNDPAASGEYVQIAAAVQLEPRPAAVGWPEGSICICATEYGDLDGPTPFARAELGDRDVAAVGVCGTWTYVTGAMYRVLREQGELGLVPTKLGRLV